ncbi:MAG: hypothetical protein R2695_00290 [Acidimicrobiales bacterium]
MRAIVCDEPLVALADEAATGIGALARIGIADTGEPGWTPLAELRATPPRGTAARVDGDDVHRLMYTSGTTGRPKG